MFDFELHTNFQRFLDQEEEDGGKRRIFQGGRIPCPRCGTNHTTYRHTPGKLEMVLGILFVSLLLGFLEPIVIIYGVVIAAVFVIFYKKPVKHYYCNDCHLKIKESDLSHYVDIVTVKPTSLWGKIKFKK